MLSPADFPELGIEPGSPALQADSLSTELSWKLREIELKPGHKYLQVLNMFRYDFLYFLIHSEMIKACAPLREILNVS